jgi:hypothetical protein
VHELEGLLDDDDDLAPELGGAERGPEVVAILEPVARDEGFGARVEAIAARSSGLLPASSPSPNLYPVRRSSDTTEDVWLTLIGKTGR